LYFRCIVFSRSPTNSQFHFEQNFWANMGDDVTASDSDNDEKEATGAADSHDADPDVEVENDVNADEQTLASEPATSEQQEEEEAEDEEDAVPIAGLPKKRKNTKAAAGKHHAKKARPAPVTAASTARTTSILEAKKKRADEARAMKEQVGAEEAGASKSTQATLDQYLRPSQDSAPSGGSGSKRPSESDSDCFMLDEFPVDDTSSVPIIG